MKCLCNKWLCFILFAMSAFLVSCEQIEIPQLDTKPSSTLKVYTRSVADADIYPVRVYAFSQKDGKLAASQTLNTPSEAISLDLAPAQYHITAISGYSEVDIPATVDASAQFLLPDGNVLTKPFMMGGSDVTVSEGAASTTNILLSYAVASVKMTIRNVPSDVRNLTVALSPVGSAVTLASGSHAESTVASIPLSPTAEDGSTWVSQDFYVVPVETSPVTFSLSVTDNANNTTTYGYTLATPFVAGTPYIVDANFTDSYHLTGLITAASWQPVQKITFSFASGEPETPASSSALPLPGSSYDKAHVCIFVLDSDNVALTADEIRKINESPTGNSYTVLLLSLNENINVPSAYSADNPTAAIKIADSYTEGGLDGWRMPTREEAILIRTNYFDSDGESRLTSLNNTIKALGGTPVTDKDDNGKNIRYLCEQATYSYSFVKSSPTTKSGATVKDYRLRLVKPISITR